MDRGIFSTDKAVVFVFLWLAKEFSCADVVRKYLRVADRKVCAADCGKSTMVTLVCHLHKPLLASKERLPAPQQIFYFQLLLSSWSGLILGFSSYAAWTPFSQPVILGDCDKARSLRHCTRALECWFRLTSPMLSDCVCNSFCSWEHEQKRRVCAALPKFDSLTELDTLPLSVKENEEVNKSLVRELSVLKKENNLFQARVLSFSNVREANLEGRQLKFLTSLDKVYWYVLWWRLQPSHGRKIEREICQERRSWPADKSWIQKKGEFVFGRWAVDDAHATSSWLPGAGRSVKIWHL